MKKCCFISQISYEFLIVAVGLQLRFDKVGKTFQEE